MSHVTAKDRLIVALDMPTVEEAQRLVVKLGPEVTFYKVGLELLFSGGLELARALKSEGKRVFLDMKLWTSATRSSGRWRMRPSSASISSPCTGTT